MRTASPNEIPKTAIKNTGSKIIFPVTVSPKDANKDFAKYFQTFSRTITCTKNIKNEESDSIFRGDDWRCDLSNI